MASFLKALLVVGVVMVLLAIAAAAAGYYWYTRHGRQFMEAARQARAEGVQFGEETDDEGCLHEALARHKQAGGLARSISHNLFLSGCLSTSEQTDGFCDGVPKGTQIVASVTWQTKRCAGAGFTDPSCRQLFAQVQQYCESDLSRPEEDQKRVKEHARR